MKVRTCDRNDQLHPGRRHSSVVRYLDPMVDDIELVLFESEERSNLPSKEVVDGARCPGPAE
jgi:hypothetical protein